MTLQRDESKNIKEQTKRRKMTFPSNSTIAWNKVWKMDSQVSTRTFIIHPFNFVLQLGHDFQQSLHIFIIGKWKEWWSFCMMIRIRQCGWQWGIFFKPNICYPNHNWWRKHKSNSRFDAGGWPQWLFY